MPDTSKNTNLHLERNVPLSSFTTFRLGGPCRGLIQVSTPANLKTAVTICLEENVPFILIGGGSNLVVSDQGVDVYVIRYWSDVPQIERNGHLLKVSGSTILDHLAVYAAENGLAGLNYTSGIPGTVGGAVVGNAGAFGKQIGDVLVSAELLTLNGEIKIVNHKELNFQYRHSALKESNDIVSSVTLKLSSSDAKQLKTERQEILDLRATKHPDLSKEPCAGSFFRNIEPTSSAGKRQAAGWFLEEAGGKSLSHGGARIFAKHANIIVKTENGTAQDVFELHKKMIEAVKVKFDLELVREVRFVGPFRGAPKASGLIW